VTPDEPINMMFGRFQPFHLGHLNFLRVLTRRKEPFIVGVTNPDPSVVRPEAENSYRHLADANPFTYFERHLMVKGVLEAEGVPASRYLIIPFAVNTPDVWKHYLPKNLTAYIPMFDDSEEPNMAWQHRKVERFKQYGYQVSLIDDLNKRVHATNVRERIVRKENWEELCPPAVVEVVRQVLASGREIKA
jgi:nicotinamide mononucleotide adenylyltransferase